MGGATRIRGRPCSARARRAPLTSSLLSMAFSCSVALGLVCLFSSMMTSVFAALPRGAVPAMPPPGSPMAQEMKRLMDPELPNGPFARAVFDEPRAPNTSKYPYFRRLFSPRDQVHITHVVQNMRTPGVLKQSLRKGGLLADPRTDTVFYSKPKEAYTTIWANGAGVQLSSAATAMTTQYFYWPFAAQSPVADIFRSWPYYFLYKDFLTQEAGIASKRVYEGLMDIDWDAFDMLKDPLRFDAEVSTPREALVLVYNDWDSGAMDYLAVLERFAKQHMRGKGANMYTDVNWAVLPETVANVLKRRVDNTEAVAEVRPDGFYRMMQAAYPVTDDHIADVAAAAEATEAAALEEGDSKPQKTLVFWLVSDRVKAHREAATGSPSSVSTPPYVSGITQLFGALRLAAFSGDDMSKQSALFSVTPTPRFVLLGSGGLTMSPALVPSSPKQVTPYDLRQFVLRHSISTVYVESYEQVARLVADYGRVALLTMSPHYLAALMPTQAEATSDGAAAAAAQRQLLQKIAGLPTIAALRKEVPFFILLSSAAPPAWLGEVAVTGSSRVDVATLTTPSQTVLDTIARVSEATARYGGTATLTIFESPLQQRIDGGNGRSGGVSPPHPSTDARWTRHEVLVPVVSPDELGVYLEDWDLIVGSTVVDVVKALGQGRRVFSVTGATFQETLMRLRGDLHYGPAAAADVVVVVDDGSAKAIDTPSCGDRLRRAALSGQADALSHTRFMTVDGSEHDLREELLRAAWPLPSTGRNRTGHTVCPEVAEASLDFDGCTVLCVPRDDKNLYRLRPWLREVEAGGRPADVSGDRPLHHLSAADLDEAVMELLSLLSEGTETDIANADHPPAAHTEWRAASHGGLPWRLYLPAGFTAPLVEYNLAGHETVIDGSDGEGLANFILLTDATCAQCANPTKAFRLIAGCLEETSSVRMHELDVREFLYAPASVQVDLLYSDESRSRMPFSLLGPSFFEGTAAMSMLRPPRFIGQRGGRVLMTLNTLAYYERLPWPRAVLELVSALFDREGEAGLPGFDAILQCVDRTIAEEAARRKPFRRALAKGSDA